MSKKEKFLASAPLAKDKFVFTLPKQVRKILNIHENIQTIGYFVENDNQVSIGGGGQKIIDSSYIGSGNRVSIPTKVRNLLEIKKNDTVGFFLKDKRIIIRNMSKM